VVFTDLFQFILMGLFVPLLGFTIYMQLSPNVSLVSTWGNLDRFSLSKLFGNEEKLFVYGAMMGRMILLGFLPHIFQRVMLTSNVLKARKAFFLSGGLWAYILICITGLSLVLLADNPGFRTDNILAFIVDKYGYTGLKGLLAVGIMAMLMSTADSYINTASVLFSNDLLKSVRTKIDSLLAARIFGALVGVVACIVAIWELLQKRDKTPQKTTRVQ